MASASSASFSAAVAADGAGPMSTTSSSSSPFNPASIVNNNVRASPSPRHSMSAVHNNYFPPPLSQSASTSSQQQQQQQQQRSQSFSSTSPLSATSYANNGTGGSSSNYFSSSPLASTSSTTAVHAQAVPASSSSSAVATPSDLPPPIRSPTAVLQQQQQQASGLSSNANAQPVVPVGFEEGTLRALCDLDCGFPLLMDRIRQSMASCRETSVFLKKRAQIEEEYGRALAKLSKERAEAYSTSEGKAGSFVTAFTALLKTHDILADNRVKFASQLVEMADQLADLGREADKSRKTTKDLGSRLERNLMDSEVMTEKSRGRFDLAVEELERILLSKAGESTKDSSNFPAAHTGTSDGVSGGKKTFGKAMSKLKGGPKNPAQIQKLEEEARARMNSMSDAYRSQVIATQAIRQEYFNLQLPRMLKALKENVDEIDLGTQFQLSRYAFLYESLVLNDALIVAPPQMPNALGGFSIEEGPGLKSIAESVDNRDDFKSFMQNYAVTFAASGQKTLRREGPPEEGFVKLPKPAGSSTNGSLLSHPLPPTPSSTSTSPYPLQSSASATTGVTSLAGASSSAESAAFFGVDLGYQMQRDGVDIPKVLEKCAEVIEAYGLDVTGIYRLSGTTSRIQKLKAKLERDIDHIDLHADENRSDINDITGVLKLFFRELPEPLFTYELYHAFIEAAKIDNPRLRHIRLHERINELPDPNYATCKFFLGHLDKVRQHEANNSMSVSNLAIVFGPTLLGPPPEERAAVLADMQWQCRAIETILEHYAEIFVDADDDDAINNSNDGSSPLVNQSQSSLSQISQHAPQLPFVGSHSPLPLTDGEVSPTTTFSDPMAKAQQQAA